MKVSERARRKIDEARPPTILTKYAQNEIKGQS